MTNSGYWHMVVSKAGTEELFREIDHCNEIERVAARTPWWGEWRRVASGGVCAWRTRLWSLPNRYTCTIKVKPVEMEFVREAIKGL